MTLPTILVATWANGLHALGETTRSHELAGESVRALTADGRGGALAIVGGRALRRRDSSGGWTTLAVADFDLASCVAMSDRIYVGTDDARVLRVDVTGRLDHLRAFDTVAGRDGWYAGTALIDGRVMGPPLGVRSMSATRDGVLLVNVHVGGIPRSVDGGATWEPTIDVEADVHEVSADPRRAGVVAAAAAVGLCMSSDGGATWQIERAGLHADHCSAVVFAGDNILVSASVGPFSPEGAVYRRRVDRSGPLVRLADGLPEWLDGKVDTGCLAALGDAAAMCDWGGKLYVSVDAGRTWSLRADGLAGPSGVLVA